MSLEIKVPVLPESVVDATIATWHKKVGDFVSQDENIVDLETDKIVLEVPSSINGVIEEILVNEGDVVLAGQVLVKIQAKDQTGTEKTPKETEKKQESAVDKKQISEDPSISPSVLRFLKENSITQETAKEKIKGTGEKGRILKEDVTNYLQKNQNKESENVSARHQRRVPMSRLRQMVASRLLEAKHTTAMLTTFNEVDMGPIMALRKTYQEKFEKEHDIRLGFMSFYVKAVVAALKRFPEVNASIDGTDIIYHNYFDISIAVSTPRGLVTPVVKDADLLSMDKVEKTIKELALKGRDNKLTVADLVGGNFTITNGGVFGSLLSTPILNPPQSAILGMHKIEKRPVVVGNEIVIKPMMYLALSYDHRIIDGKESVGFLVAIKEMLEDPTRILLDI